MPELTRVLKNAKPDDHDKQARERWTATIVKIADLCQRVDPSFNRLEFYLECSLGQ
jgi:hypothetical protein